jgi:hypothetical protein
VAGPLASTTPGAARSDYLTRQYDRLSHAAELCYRITSRWPLPETLASADQLVAEIATLELNGASRIDAEKPYIERLNGIFTLAFSGLSQGIKLYLPQFQESLAFLDGFSLGHGFPSYAICEEDLRRLTGKVQLLRDSLSRISPDATERAWAFQFSGGTEVIKQTEDLYKKIEAGIARAATERRAQAQEQATEEANTFAKEANEIAKKADQTARGTMLWAAAAAAIALLAIGWDAYKWWDDQNEKLKKESATSSQPYRPASSPGSLGPTRSSAPSGPRVEDSAPPVSQQRPRAGG